MISPNVSSESMPSDSAAYSSRQPLVWITTIAEQIAIEAGLTRTPDIEDLVINVYIGLLDSQDPNDLSEQRLLTECRQELVTWAWEQGCQDEGIPLLGNAGSDTDHASVLGQTDFR